MKIKLNDIVNDYSKFTELTEIKLPLKTSYKIQKANDKIMSEVKQFFKQKDKIVQEYGEENDQGGFSVKPENKETFKKEINDLLELEVDLDIEKVKIEELGDIQIEPKLLIGWMFE